MYYWPRPAALTSDLFRILDVLVWIGFEVRLRTLCIKPIIRHACLTLAYSMEM